MQNKATRAVKFDRAGIRGHIYACDKCLGELYSAIAKTVVPKSVETARRKNDKGGKR